MGRAPCCEKIGLKKGRWTAEEDNILSKYIQANGEGSWRSLPKNAGLLRCGKSCRLRWINYLRNDLKRGNISKQEEDVIIKLHASLGNKWSLIASQIEGRTDNEIKNYWNSHLSRKIDTFRRPNGEPLPSILNLNNIIAKKRRGGRTSRSAMKKNKIMMTFIKNTNKLIKSSTKMVQKNDEFVHHELPCPNLEDVGEGMTNEFMLFDKMNDDQENSHEMLGLHVLQSFNTCSDQIMVNSADVESGNLSSNGESGGGGGGEWWSCSSKASNLENGGLDWEWESFVNENVWNNNDHEQDEMLSWLRDSDTIKNGEGDIQSEKQEALVAWLLS